MIVLRGDAKPGIGTGDLVSLMHLALGLESIGVKTALATQDTKEARSILQPYPHEVLCLPIQNPVESAKYFQAACDEKGWRQIFWEITECSTHDILYSKSHRHMGVVFEEPPPLEWDFVLCWDPVWSDKLRASQPPYPHLLGPQYVLLHPTISEWVHPGCSQVKNILITMGGNDEKNYSSQILRSLRLQGLTAFEVTIICGPGYSHEKLLELELSLWPQRPKVLKNIKEIFKLFSSYSCVISAGGLTASELILTQTPAILYATVPHQISRCEYFQNQRWCLYQPSLENTDFERCFSKLSGLTASDWIQNPGTQTVAQKIKSLLF